ncbi:MAG: hypothetical protein ACK2U9_23220, partial [Anaerolineae bacterium]
RAAEDRSPVPGCPEIRRRISVGDRLLIYLAEPADADLALERIGVWVATGRAERDRRGMNRLRLVVALDGLNPATTAAMQHAFSRLPELQLAGTAAKDPRIHLHCLPQDALASI